MISDIQIRLNEQRIRAEHIEKQTNTSLEMKIYDMTNEIICLREKLQKKDKLVSHQQSLLIETQQRLHDMENELESKKDDEIIIDMQKELENLRKENAEMRNRFEKEAAIVPNLVENIISDKNMNIEKLKEKLEGTEKLLDDYRQFNLSTKDLQTLSNLKNSGTSLTEVLSILDLSQAEQVRRLENSNSECFSTPEIFKPKRNQEPIEETVLEPELSAISPAILHCIPQTRNSTAVSHKKVHFEDTTMENLRSEIANLEEKLKAQDEIIKTYEERLQLLNNLESKIEKLQLSLEETEKALATATETFEREQQELRNREKDLGIQLAEKKLKIDEQEKRIELLEQDSNRKDEMCLSLAKEKRELENAVVAIKHDNFQSIDAIIKEKNKEIEDMQIKLSAKNKGNRDMIDEIRNKEMEIHSLQTDIDHYSSQYSKLQDDITISKEKLKESNKENDNLTKELQNKIIQIESISNEHNNIREKLNKKRKLLRDHEDAIERHKGTITALELEVKNLKDIIADRECEIEIANEDAKRYQNDIAALEYEIKLLKKSDIDNLNQQLKEKDVKINELVKEKTQMIDLVNEKETIINQMAEDSHQLHVNLMTIKSKIKEPGNIIDLGNKLREEQKKNAELLQKIHELKAQLLKFKNSAMMTSVEDITDQLKKELDYSAQIDSNIINAVSDHSLSSISETQDVEIYKKALTKEKISKKQLLSQINVLEAKNSELMAALQREKNILVQIQTDDAKLIEQLRIQLDTVLDSETNIRQALEDKTAQIRQLDDELSSLKKQHTVSTASRTDSTEYKSLPSHSSRELNQLRKDYEIVRSDKNALLNNYILLQHEQVQTEKSLEYTRQQAELGTLREKQLEQQIQNMLKNEMDVKENMVQMQLRVEQLMVSNKIHNLCI